VVVEQPELHLHPAFQGKLADVFAACVRVEDGDSVNPRVIAETHSPNLIGRLGELVGQGQVRPTDVSVLVFEPDENQPGATAIRRAEFDDGGVLQNWPVGFFDA
jgi:predicted ATPase